ncbi:hypothetical protein HPP92_022251 [Vanilla planifolia]|uniref:noroxomaritidine synthase n=1 Tax=Vanilla planifolia TaxID=51239 RepID=A0A835PSZ7_VANPL|nr:hypothetical protein HPP92_022251 [Vanilla planifolia]
MEMPVVAELPALLTKLWLSLFAFYLLKFILKLVFSKKKYPPIGGTILHQFLNFHRLQDYQTELSRHYKTFRVLTPFRNYIYTVDPANVEYILKTNFENFGKGIITYEVVNDLLGDGIFAVDGEKWRHQRKVASFEFSAKVLRDYSSLVFRSNAAKLSELVSVSADSNETMDIQDLFMKTTLDSIFKVGFGVDLDTLGGSNDKGRAFAKAFDDSSCQILRRYFDLFWKMKRMLNIGLEGQMKRDIELINDFVFKVVDEKIEQLSHGEHDKMPKEDILSRLLVEREKDPETISQKYLRDIVLNFVIAGRDTTAGTLSWFFHLLCKHHDVQEKISQEVRAALKTGERLSRNEFHSS